MSWSSVAGQMRLYYTCVDGNDLVPVLFERKGKLFVSFREIVSFGNVNQYLKSLELNYKQLGLDIIYRDEDLHSTFIAIILYLSIWYLRRFYTVIFPTNSLNSNVMLCSGKTFSCTDKKLLEYEKIDNKIPSIAFIWISIDKQRVLEPADTPKLDIFQWPKNIIPYGAYN